MRERVKSGFRNPLIHKFDEFYSIQATHLDF